MTNISNNFHSLITNRGSQSKNLPIKIFFAFEVTQLKSSNWIIKNIKKLQLFFSKISSQSLNKFLSINVICDSGIIFFHFTDEDVKKIRDFQSKDYKINKIKIEPYLLGILRKNIFLSDKSEFHYGVDFITCYHDNFDNTQQEIMTLKQCHNCPNKVIKTFISIDGDIIQKIRKDYLFSNSFQEIIACHYWLINQILKYFQTKLIAFLTNLIRLLFAASSLSSLIPLFPGIFPHLNTTIILAALPKISGQLLLTILTSILLIFDEQIQAFLLPRIKGWIWRQIMNPKSSLQRISQWLLGRI